MQLLDINRPHASGRSGSPQQWPVAAHRHTLDVAELTGGGVPTAAERWRFKHISAGGRGMAENFIAAQFRKAYGARITEFMPELMGLYDGETLAAVCGLRTAASGRLFLEQYLEHPADILLNGMTGRIISRLSMVEVGNLSISRPGYARHLVFWLTMHLHDAGMEWVVFSAVPALRNNFLRLGIPLVTLGAARPDRLPDGDVAAWGSYYEQQPLVTAVSVEAALKALGDNTCKR